MKLYKKDIKAIGHTNYGDHNDNTVFECSPSTYRLEEILLREMLLLFGDYKILSSLDDATCENIQIITDLPWSKYMEL